MEIKVLLKKYLPDIVVLGMLVVFYLHSQAIHEQLFSLLDNVEPVARADGDYDIKYEVWKINKNVNQIWIYFILFIVVINFFRQKQKRKEV